MPCGRFALLKEDACLRTARTLLVHKAEQRRPGKNIETPCGRSRQWIGISLPPAHPSAALPASRDFSLVSMGSLRQGFSVPGVGLRLLDIFI